ncbi:MAG: hypothetical protein QHH18_00350 [Candidatus Bathyarchaeota archaeon]|jgi:hypothetical protein|nr:hypothetical protein [Candidatus Bathyarchaeota archaeon A05DMB-5]MDH7557044.1 hypothetical protein [Candidatus Bathyarchaeota archaeon]
MSIKSKFTTENMGMYAASAFYIIAGIILLTILPFANFPLHISIIGILSIVTAYGLIRKRFWTIWLVIILFFTATTFSAYTIFTSISSLGKNLIYDISTIAYLILTWIFTAYIATKRKTLES